jgi:serine phosphatase RsbU (regulator of sigma subunit)
LLNGSWEFYWGKLLSPEDFKNQSLKELGGAYLIVPGIWTGQQFKNETLGSYGYGTYRLRIKLDKTYPTLAVKLFTISTAYKLYINGVLMTTVGKVGTNAQLSIPDYQSQWLIFSPDTQEIEIIIHNSNYHYWKGGLWGSIQLGNKRTIERNHQWSILMDFFLVGGLSLMCLYHIGLYWIRKDDPSLLYFSILCFLVVFRTLNTGEYLMRFVFPDLPWHWIIRLEFLGFFPSVVIFSIYLSSLFPKEKIRFLSYLLFFSTVPFIVLVLLTPVSAFSTLAFPYQILSLVLGLFFLVIIFTAVVRKRSGVWVFLSGFSILLATFVNDVLLNNYVIDSVYLVPLGMYLFIFSQAYLLSLRFYKLYKRVRTLKRKLADSNRNLERAVSQKTQNLKRLNKDLRLQYQNTQDSINYALRIQKAIFVEQSKIQKAYNEAFILLKPKDIVSGDFYWFAEVSDQGHDYCILAVADCTGHGVPGAFMSMIGINALNQMVFDYDLVAPDKILEHMRISIKQTLQQADNQNKDGMDISILVWDKKSNHIQFSGARRPLIIIQNNEIEIIKGDIINIGGEEISDAKHFTRFEKILDKETQLYLFTDGFQDQFGKGEKKQEKFLFSRFRNLLLEIHVKDMEEQKQDLENSFDSWKQDLEQTDDVLVVGLKIIP